VTTSDVIVVGGGLFGKIAAAWLAREGAVATVVSDDREGAGSAAAGCVIRPSWVGSMTTSDLSEALEMLSELYGVRDVRFSLPLGRHATCHCVEPATVLGAAQTRGVCESVFDDGVRLRSGETLGARRGVVVAAGVWTQSLCPWVGTVESRWGWAHRGPAIGRAVISVWAPYRQVVAFDMLDGRSWAGDGSALKRITDERARASLARCLAVTGCAVERTISILGARPYAETSGEPCLVRRRGRVWAATGGAKNGTAAAAWAARRIAREVLS